MSDVTQRGGSTPGEWVLLTYRLPRVPSTPRSTVWRKLKRLGVVQLADGLVALPADARTREQLDWIAVEVREAHGAANVWLARPTSISHERELARTMAADRAAEYLGVKEAAEATVGQEQAARQRAVRKLRDELRRIRRRDFFPPPERDAAVAAVEQLATVTRPAEAGGRR